MSLLPNVDPLADLRVNYYARLRSRVESLDEFVRDLLREDGPTAESVADNHRLVHSMISSSAIFGFVELSKAARVTEKEFEEHSSRGGSALVSQVKRLIQIANAVLNDVNKTTVRIGIELGGD